MKKKIVSILLCVTMVAAMAVGCGSKDGGSDSKSESGDSKDKKYKVGITIQSLSNAYWAGVMGKLEEQLKDKGWDYTLIDCEDNSATQVSQIENFIKSLDFFCACFPRYAAEKLIIKINLRLG